MGSFCRAVIGTTWAVSTGQGATSHKEEEEVNNDDDEEVDDQTAKGEEGAAINSTNSSKWRRELSTRNLAKVFGA